MKSPSDPPLRRGRPGPSAGPERGGPEGRSLGPPLPGLVARERKARGGPAPRSRFAAVAPFVAVTLAIAGAVFALTRPFDDRLPDEGEGGGGGAAATTARAPRCSALAEAPALRVGDAGRAAEPAAGAGGDHGGPPDPDPPASDDEGLEPFAAEVGPGTSWAGGFAAGVTHDTRAGTVAEIALVGDDGAAGQLVDLGRVRGDLDAPSVTALSDGLLVGLLEPNAGGYALRLATYRGSKLTWGPELQQGRDESLAFDLAASGGSAVAVWDDVRDDRGAIVLATLDPETLEPRREPRVVSSSDVDAELPRVVVRPGGFWLAYLARPRMESGVDAGAGDYDPENAERFAAESIAHGWIEILPLGHDGLPSGEPRAVTPRGGYALAFDLAGDSGGAAVVAYRDDDTPTGSDGGRLALVEVVLGGAGQPAVVLEEGLGSGAPGLFDHFVVATDARGGTLVGWRSEGAATAADFSLEPSLARSEVLAARAERLFAARPVGKALELFVVGCRADARDAGL